MVRPYPRSAPSMASRVNVQRHMNRDRSWCVVEFERGILPPRMFAVYWRSGGSLAGGPADAALDSSCAGSGDRRGRAGAGARRTLQDWLKCRHCVRIACTRCGVPCRSTGHLGSSARVIPALVS